MDTGGYTALDFALQDSHVLNANVFMRPLGRVGIHRVLQYNLYSGARVTDVPYIYYWGEPERAPHRRVERSRSIYIYTREM